MRKRIKKHGFHLLFLICFSVLLGGCSDSASEEAVAPEDLEDSAAMENYAVGDQFKANEPLTFSVLYSNHPGYQLQEDWLFWDELTKRTNVTLDPTTVPMSDYDEKRSLLINSGDAPYIIPKTYPGQEQQFLASGVILPVSDYIDLMPNLKAKIEQWDMDEDLNAIRQKDGKFYVLPGLHEAVWPDYTLAVRTDILEENNIPMPTSWEELEDVLLQLKEIYPDKTPWSERWKFESTLNFASTAFGTVGGWGLGDGLAFDEEKEEFVFAPGTENHKNMVTYFSGLVEQGLLDKSSFTQEDEQAIQKFISGESFFIATNSQEIVRHRLSMNETLGEGNFKIEKLLLPAGPEGPLMGGSRLENGVMILDKAKDDPNFKSMMQFIDWLWYSDEGLEFAKWGVEGTTYDVVDGKRVLKEDITHNGINAGAPTTLQEGFGFSNGVFAYGGSTELLHSMMSEEELAWQETMAENREPQKPEPPRPYSQEQREMSSLSGTPLLDYAKSNTLKFIVGQRDLSEWDAYVAELQGKGVQEYVGIANEAYKEYKESNEQ
ncbi:extracellular solute-binding protein [Aureibacillus halotolerans]|uniref:Carbohydrate ABC transporter substrate-binding protein (CUT1 family) n=1 Tax=Aureibacillus halotolerans TaxID=1508390 RepID=A0A4R6U8B2_9BACI|nr:extracellular solute-binding protein [Aureibacillus halotolerans]TDQ42621.1 carbohydrate ABC transporter substrate-binding protein (CUT1 family) [Aureibacillus halotolerans]